MSSLTSIIRTSKNPNSIEKNKLMFFFTVGGKLCCLPAANPLVILKQTARRNRFNISLFIALKIQFYLKAGV